MVLFYVFMLLGFEVEYGWGVCFVEVLYWLLVWYDCISVWGYDMVNLLGIGWKY